MPNANEEVVPFEDLPQLNEHFVKKIKKIDGGVERCDKIARNMSLRVL